MKVDLTNTDVGGFGYEFLRAVSLEFAGAARLGECLAIAGAIRDGDFESWTRAWTTLADRTSDERGPDPAAGRLLRAANYYRSAAFYVAPEDERHRTLWARSRDCFRRAAAAVSDGGSSLLPFPSSAAGSPVTSCTRAGRRGAPCSPSGASIRPARK